MVAGERSGENCGCEGRGDRRNWDAGRLCGGLPRCRVRRPEDGDCEACRQGKAAGSLCIQAADHGQADGYALGSGWATRLS